jgi:DNA mismatch repair protein MutL
MRRIKILPLDLTNKIAAGEIVERPASVVKELMENALDAAATDIKIDVLYGGKHLIRVSDNGIGMDKQDALLCFERHATSKLSGEEDLFNIRTMGFRGEALPSIASVSMMKIVTGRKEDPAGVSLEITGGEVKDIKDSPAAGTTVEIRDLFFNTPARKKFLKSNSTELFHIIDIVTKEALSHWKTGFVLSSDNKETINLPPASGAKERIMQVYGGDFLGGLIETHAEARGISMKSFVTKTDNFRGTRSHQFIFINSRPVKDKSLSHAVYSAYEGIIPRDKHPIFFLFLDIDPVKVDVNVHPTKREVRFEDKESIYRFINHSVKKAVKEDRLRYTKQFTEMPEVSYNEPEVVTFDPYYPSVVSHHDPILSENLELTYRPSLPFIYLGDTFVALSGKGGLMVIDHHAAHERVLYERFLKGISLDSHQLLFPRQVRLPHREYKVMLENLQTLKGFGIEADDFGNETLIIRSLPCVLQDADIGAIMSDMASCFLDGIAPDKSIRETLAARIACHSSVRGRTILNQEELSALLEDLEKADYPDQCPHGRPTRIFFSLDELKKIFKRK